MGVYLAEVQVYIDAAQKASQILMAKVFFTAFVIILLILYRSRSVYFIPSGKMVYRA